MTEYGQQLEVLFESALKLPCDQRAAFVRSSCHDETMRAQLLQLIALCEEQSDVEFLASLGGLELTEWIRERIDEGSTKVLTSPMLDTSLEKTRRHVHSMGRRPELPVQFGEYELVREIARGGMGVVYEARQVALNRTVAVKMILSGEFANDDQIKRFHMEAEAAAHLDHPGIVPIYEVGERSGRHFFSMAFVNGRGLNEYFKERPLSAHKAAEYLRKIAGAVGYAHQQGVLHRDLKPSNVLIDQNDEPRITDFGLAKRVGSDSGLTMSGQILGTPSYMPPEQARGYHEQIGVCSDVYSMGAILYALVTGRPPFQADDIPNTLAQVCDTDAVSPRLLNSAIDVDLETICLHCLEKDADNRYESAKALEDELGRYLRREPIQARPIGRSARTWRWCRRNPVVSALIGTVALTLMIGTVVSTVLAIAAVRNARSAYTNELLAEDRADEAEDARGEAVTETLRANDERDRADGERGKAEAARDRAEKLLYLSRIRAVQTNWENAEVEEARRNLAACAVKYRDWEFGYMQALLGKIFSGHTDTVRSVAFSEDGRRIVSGSHDGTVRIWDTERADARMLNGHKGRVTCVAFSRQGRFIASGSQDLTVRVWDTETMKEVLTLNGHRGFVECIAFSPDGTRLATGSQDNTLKVWNTASGEIVHDLRASVVDVISVKFSPDGTKIVSSGLNIINVWNSADGSRLSSIPIATGGVWCVAFSPDGTQIAAGVDRLVKVWDASNGTELFKVGKHDDTIRSIDYSPDGERLVAAGDDGTVKVWDVAKDASVFTLPGHPGRVNGVAFSPTGSDIVSCGDDQRVIVWRSTKPLLLKGHIGGIHGFAITPDGAKIVSGGVDRRIIVWDWTTGERIHSLRTGSRHPYAIATNSTLFVSAESDGTIREWDLATGSEVRQLEGHDDSVTGVGFSAVGEWIVSASEDGTIRLWEAATGELKQTIETKNKGRRGVRVDTVADKLAFVDGGKNIRVWNIGSLREVVQVAVDAEIYSNVAISSDGKRISAGDEHGLVRIWDAESGRLILRCEGHSESVLSVAFNGSGRRLVSGGKDKSVKIWDVDTGEEVLTLRGHEGWVSQVTFSSDDTQIVSAETFCMQPKIRIWTGFSRN